VLNFAKSLYISNLRNHPLCRLFINEKKLVSADPEFVIANRNLNMVAIEVRMFMVNVLIV